MLCGYLMEVTLVKIYQAQCETMKEKWCKLNNFVVVEKQVIQKGKITNSLSYGITDLELPAKEFAKGVRGDWGIGNGIHW